MQDRGQGHCKNNATSGEYFKHDRGQAKGTHKTHKQIPDLFSEAITLLIFLMTRLGRNRTILHSHSLEGTVSVHCKG